MRLLILLAVLSSFDEHGVAEGLKDTNTWAMQIDANVTEAPKIAGKYGFTFEMKVCMRHYNIHVAVQYYFILDLNFIFLCFGVW